MLQNYSIWKTAELFFLEPTKKHYLKEISIKLSIAHTSIKNNLKELKKLGIIIETIEKRGSRKFPIYTANLEDNNYKKYKKISNLFLIYESGIIEFLRDNLMPHSIVLFGSYSRGEDIEESDIDLYIECEKNEINLQKFGKKLHRKIETHFKSNFQEYPKELKNNIINGIVLSGYLEAINETNNK